MAVELNKLGALAFFPPRDVISAYEELLQTTFYIDNHEALADILDYMESVWLGRLMRGGRRKEALYSLQIWNQYENVKLGLYKTNNVVESWHNCFSKLLGAMHPTIWKVIDGFKKQQTLTELKIEQQRAGHVIQRKKKYANKDSRIQTLVNSYDGAAKMELLNGVSYNILD